MSFEDNISEQTIKSGFQNKPLITNESNTARPSLWSQLKKNGPTMLSSLFVNLLEKRQSNGRLTAPWNFKLPPLLTMTPTRRESFLHELADPTWPLRKLMRSLPRGVGGKVLLDQCLDKFIPTPRAVWLAKCIGAHDLRAIKRKSTTSTSAANSEAKWVKEWTMHVEQFIKAAISAVGDANWKSKVDYVLRLSAHLFSGRLLDEDHFLDWILTSLETSTFDQLPVWLLLVRIYTKPIVSSRRRGKRLAEALLCHLDEQDYSADFDDLTQPVIQMVQDTLSTLAKTKSMCFLFSRNWNKFRGLLQAISERAVSLDVKQAIADIACRNERISGQFSIKSSPGASEQIIRLLDSEGLKIPSNKLASRCLELISDVAVLLDIIMRWAASPYRQGRHRVYLAARLLRAISDQERDIDEIIWAVVEKHGNNPAMHESDLFQVVIELIRPRHFSVGKFLQHLIATGAFSHIESAHNSPLVRLLKQIPDHDVSEGVSNLRANLLESAGLESFVETEIYLEVQKCVDSQLAQVGISANIESLTPLPHLTALSQNQKFALGLWLRGKMIEAYENSVDFEPVPDGLLSGKVVMSVFFIIRHALEQLQEYPCLADVIGLLLGTSNQSLLTSLSQTLHYGYRSFIAMGAMKSLFERLTATYEGLRTPAPLERPFCVALLELCSSLQATKSLVTQITQDLVRCDQLFAAVCSPASDLTADTPAAGGVEFDADLDRVLLSGTTMDQLTFERMFKRISGRMEEAYREDATLTVPAGTWLSRLRAFDPSNFDLLTHKWVSSLLSSLHDQQCLYSYVLPILLGSSSMSFLDFLKLAKSLQNSSTSESISFQIQSKINRITALLPGMGPVTDIGIVVRVLFY
jgi:mediator of RNA polymerase II transcription subunit 12